MATHRFAIDETGSFSIKNNATPSFVCGVAISCNELSLKQKYQEAFEKLGYGKAPDNIKDIIGHEEFHFSGLNDSSKKICQDILLPWAEKIYISKGEPAIFANNQNWWLIAVSVVISEYLRNERFDENDDVKIYIDNRHTNTWGVINCDDIKFTDYHDWMKDQIDAYVKSIKESRKINLEIKFQSDTSNWYINLADLVCGFVRKFKHEISQPITECHCNKFTNGDNPANHVKSNPTVALSLIFQEIINGKYYNIGLVKNIFSKLRTDGEAYNLAWDMFYDLIKSLFAARSSHSQLVQVKELVQLVKEEFGKSKEKLSGSRRLEIMVLFTEYFSHIGSITAPFTAKDFEKELRSTTPDSETRLLRKWEKLVSFKLRRVQINFNAYEFEHAVNDFATLWENQDNILTALPDTLKCLTDDIQSTKDENTTAIIGSLAQAYAYKGEIDNAIEYFKMSKEYAIKTGNRTASYLFALYQRTKDIDNARMQFEAQTGKTPEKFAADAKYTNQWDLLSYCKLRALELWVNRSTSLPSIDVENLAIYSNEYPYPMIMKWEGIALWLEDGTKNKARVERLFSKAIESLYQEENGFAIKTLSLPIIQCYAVVNNQNPYHAKYNNILNELKKESPAFSKFVDSKSALLNNIKNSEEIWERAISLPFIYA